MSSFDVVRRVHRELGGGRTRGRVTGIGHAGTLDPMASGVLLVLLGEATRLSRFLMAQTKEYDAEVLFGFSTDTDDVTGQVAARGPVPKLTSAQLREALTRFVGSIEQVPPRYSALKHEGQALYSLARRGRAVQPKPRTVTVHLLELLDWTPPRARLHCEVSSGTYIRALARDIGAALGSAATLAELVRTRVGRFRLNDALRFDALSAEAIGARVVPVEQAVPGLGVLTVDVPSGRALGAGRPVSSEYAQAVDGLVLVRTDDGAALYLVRSEAGMLHPVRMIYAD